MSNRIQGIIDRFNRIKNKRDSEWNALLQDGADFTSPRKNNITSKKAGRKLEIYNSTARLCNGKLAAGLYAYLCPSSKRWFSLRAKNNKLQKLDSVKRWFAEVSQICFENLANSNFNLAMHENLLDYGPFGVACIYQAEGKRKALSYKTIHITEYYFLENEDGDIDTVFRVVKLTARQAVQKFGEDKLHADIKKAAKDNKDSERDFEFIHVVFPREEYDKNKRDAENMPFVSLYIDLKNKKEVSESGYQEMPYHVSRFTKFSGSEMGCGPAFECMCELKLVSKMDYDLMLALEKHVKPSWIAPDDDSDLEIDDTPGGITYYNPALHGGKPEQIQNKANVPLGKDEVIRKEDFISKAFYNDLFAVLGDRNNMTATEVIERVEERLIAFAPTLGRLESELFNPLLNRQFGILMRQGELPPPPTELLEDPQYEIEYIGKMALAVKLLENKSFTQTFEMIVNLVEFDKSILDNFDMDKITQGMAHNNGMSMDWLHGEDEVEAIRSNRAKQQEQLQKFEQLKELAGAVPNLQKETHAGSPMEALTEGLK